MSVSDKFENKGFTGLEERIRKYSVVHQQATVARCPGCSFEAVHDIVLLLKGL